MRKVICSLCNTEDFHEAKGLCKKCYQKLHTKNKKKLVICISCNQNSEMYSRGLCKKCYQKNYRLNLLNITTERYENFKCKICNSNKDYKAKGLCKKCYLRNYNLISNTNHKSKKLIICSLCNTKTFHEAKGLCSKCYSKNKYLKVKSTLNHKFHKRIQSFRRRAKMKLLKHDFTMDEWKLKLSNTNGICPNCFKNVGIDYLTIDHILPLSKAPRNYIYSINDVQPLCVSCNSSKKDRIL